MPVALVEENGLEDVILVRHGGDLCIVLCPELVLVVGAVKGHFNLGGFLGIGMGVVHWSEAGRFAVLALGDFFGFGEFDLVFFGFGFGFCTEGWVEVGFVGGLEIGAVGVGDCDVVVEFGAAEDEFFFPGCGFSQEFFCVVS